MRTQHISDVYNDVVSITQLRRDISVFLHKLETEKEVKVLKGHKVLFIASIPDKVEVRKNAKKGAVDFFVSLRRKHKTSLSSIVIKDRDRMKTKRYYATDRS